MSTALQMIYDNYTGEERNTLLRAYHYAEEAHSGQKRASGEAYFIHPCAVAQILMELGLDCATVAAAFLHDVIEDTPVTEEDIRSNFGDEVLQLVSGVTKLDKIFFKSHEEEEAENFRKIFVAMAKDIRVIIIKLADRLHNMRSLNFLSKERQQRMARETLDIYTPLAGRLGISQIKCELEDLCLKYLEPEAYEFLVENIHQKLYERHNFVDYVVKEIKAILDESKIEGEVFGRPKHFYSIYKKMTQQNKSLEQIYDLTAVRVIVGTVDECYEVFGKIHKRWKPIPGRIKDYIATPQAEHVPVPAHDGRHRVRAALRDPDPHLRDAQDGRVRYRGALEVQGEKGGRLRFYRASLVDPRSAGLGGRFKGLQGLHGVPQNGAVFERTSGVHPEGEGHFARQGRDPHRLCLRHPQRDRL